MAADIYHANMPIGPVGRATEFQLFFNQMIFRYTKYPKAAKEFLRFMMEAEQVDPWVQAAIGYVTPALKHYEKNPIWTVDPKHTPYRNSMVNMLPSGYAGRMGYASAGALSDFIVDARTRRLRCVRVIHGKGLTSPGKEPVLKGKVRRWLAHWDEVLAYAEAPRHAGGGGALLVLLKGSQ